MVVRSDRLIPPIAALVDEIRANSTTMISSARYPQRINRSRFFFPPVSTTRRRIGLAGRSRQKYSPTPSMERISRTVRIVPTVRVAGGVIDRLDHNDIILHLVVETVRKLAAERGA